MLRYTNLFSPNDYEENEIILLKTFSITEKIKKNYIALFAVNIEHLENLKHHTKTLVFSIICNKLKNEDGSIDIFKILALIDNIKLNYKYESII